MPLARLPDDPTPGALLDAFLDWAAGEGFDLYPAQESAILELLDGNHVVLETPTGSGKSLVALANHVAAIASGQRSFYTAPIKALVSEKFFELCRVLGAEHVGMITGDAAVNADAPVVCCTAEILSDLALREGETAGVDRVCMDEFHYYGDPQRGTAWQVPLLELPHTQFLLMSATLGNTAALREDLERRTGRPAVLVASGERPVPLSFEYRETLLLDTLQELLDTDRAPVYVVHFTQAAATERAQALTSLPILDRAGRTAVNEAIGGFRFDSPFGRDLGRFVRHGIGVHHAGLLPKYRLLVEKLAQQGLLKVICGTDTLGVGVNVPIRTVLFTQLCKYDGTETRILKVREFQQIAGRAGRRGFDREGFVWVQAPEHVVENLRADEKAAAAAASGGKRRKVVKRKPPERGFKPWNRDTFHQLVDGRPETLESSFQVSHAMVLEVLDRPGDGCRALRDLLLDNHEPRTRQRGHVRRAIHIYRALLAAGVLERLTEPDELARRVRVHGDLQRDFRLDRPLAPFALEFLADLDAASEEYALDALSVVEAVLENPTPVLLRQLDRARDDLIARLKSEGVEYEERMAELALVEWPKPLRDELYAHFNRFSAQHPWVGQDNVRPKSVARDLYERSMTFREYVNEYGIKRSEGLLLRYLSDAYKGLVQMVPEEAKTTELLDLTEWLGTMVRQVDASLLEEWERVRAGDAAAVVAADRSDPLQPPDVTANARSFRILVANELFRWVQHLARREEDRLVGALDDSAAEGRSGGWSADALRAAMAPYWVEHERIDTGPDARSQRHVIFDDLPSAGSSAGEAGWRVRQALADPERWYEWKLVASVDVAASRAEGRAVMRLEAIERL
jgi:superfamily II RNA helicase